MNAGVAPSSSYLNRKLLERVGLALLEAGFVGLVGLIPLVLAPYLNAHDPQVGVEAANGEILNLISSGQLYLYCFSLEATILWLYIENSKYIHIFFSVIIIAAIFIIGIVSIAVFIQNPAMLNRISHHLITLSIVSYISCILIYFFLIMCKSSFAPTLSETFDSDVIKLVKEAKGLIG